MGKKTKIGKARKDKFYHLAKESGYRSRAAFKLIQLNRTHEFLQRSRVLLDLCAAPGGWLQVAKQFMPVSSLIIGVDLVPIKPVPNVLTIQDDITTEHCKQALRHELKNWKVDVVLHDGAPNVGKNWIHDAFTQSRLTLSAFKLATDFLQKGGWFITKVFRSKDYHALLWVFQQLFKKVVATKPPASRNESAEIFVVCSGYLAPDRIDPRLLDSRHVFEDVEDGGVGDGDSGPVGKTTGANKLNLLMNPEKKKKSAEGYGDGKLLLLEKLSARQYVEAEEDKSKELLAGCHEIVFDEEDKEIGTNPNTTEEIKECCRDIKVLGKRELRLIMNWRKKIRAAAEKAAKADEKTGTDALVKITPFGEGDEEAEIQKQIHKVEEDERLEARRKRKRLNKLRRQLQEKMNLKMVIPGDKLLPDDIQMEDSLFALTSIRSQKGLEKVAAEDASPDLEDGSTQKKRRQDEKIEEEEEDNPLLVGRETTKSRKDRMVEEWFEKEIFADLDWSEGDQTVPVKTENKSFVKAEHPTLKATSIGRDESLAEENYPREDVKPVRKLDPEGFALAEEMIKSKKRRKEILEAGFHREAFNEPDTELPAWFVEDEKKFCRKSLVDMGLVSKEQVQTYKDQLKAIDARPIKKVAEAQARKKRRAVKRLEKARKKAGKVLNEDGSNQQLSSQEKMQQLKTIYKKAGVFGKKKSLPPTIVVSKRGGGTSRSDSKPAKGSKIKVVDRRMKKDLRGMKAKKGKGKKAGKGGSKSKSKK